MEMQTGVRKLVLHFHKIHLNKHVPACHSSLNLECNTATVKKHRGNFTGSSTKSNLDGEFTYQQLFLQRDALVIIKPDFKPHTKQSIIGIGIYCMFTLIYQKSLLQISASFTFSSLRKVLFK